MISIIVARDPNGVIGLDNTLPWSFPEDLQHFKRTTLGHPIIMGRLTYESLPRRPLPGRVNIVLTRDPDFKADGAIVTHSFEDAIAIASPFSPKTFIIGGEEIYRTALPWAQEIILTRINQVYEGNRFFRFLESEWEVTDILQDHRDFTIMRLSKKPLDPTG